MIDENSTMGEVLEFRAYTMPFKVQQLIDICEAQANSLSDFAYNVYDDWPEEREKWLKHAEEFRSAADDMRKQNWLIRAGAENAKEELDELT